jgi:serine/threonine protein kinase
MGVVWQAWLFLAPDGPRGAEGPIPVALKILRRQADTQPSLRILFANEAEALRSLHHPHVVGFHDFFEWGRSLVLAMEFVEGSTLEQLVARHRARAQISGPGAPPGVPFPRAWYYYQQLLGALAATHALGFVHRDVKPSNVLVRRDGIVKLTDFGIARLVGQSVNADEARSEVAPGTGAYMSPEQVLSRPVDARSDLYSAAIVFYELLAGRPPFSPEEKTEFLLRQAQVELTPPPLSAFVPHANVEMDGFFARALAKDPRYRFASAIELGEAARTAGGERATPGWRAQAEIASQAPEAQGPEAQGARERKLATLREFVVTDYRAANPTR